MPLVETTATGERRTRSEAFNGTGIGADAWWGGLGVKSFEAHPQKSKVAMSREKATLLFVNLRTKSKIIGYFTSFALACWMMLLLAPDATLTRFDNNIANLLSFTMFSKHPVFKGAVADQYLSSFELWKGRWAANFCASHWWDFWMGDRPVADKTNVTKDFNIYTFTIVWSSYFALWFFAYCCICVSMRDDWPLFVLGGFAAIIPNLAWVTTAVFMPWDVTSLCFFALGVFLFEKKHFEWIFPVAIIGSCFKETTLVLMILPWLVSGDKNRKIIWTIAAIAFFGICRFVSCGGVVGHLSDSGLPQWEKNINLLFDDIGPAHFIFTDFALVITIWFLPMNWRLKVLAGAFMGGLFFMGGFNESRQWFELAPIGLVGLSNITKISPSAADTRT